MSDKLPSLIDPVLLCERRSVLSGAIDVGQLARLAELLADADQGQVEVVVNFGKQGKRSVIEGRIQAALILQCQACMEALSWPLDLHFRLGVVTTIDEIEGLEVDCEPLLFQGEKLSFNDLIEDELLLAIPDYPKHDSDCMLRSAVDVQASVEEIAASQKPNPFSVLANLKKAGD